MKGIDKSKMLSYVWRNCEHYSDAFKGIGVSNIVVKFSGEDISDVNCIYKAVEIDADGREMSGDAIIFQKLSQWYTYLRKPQDIERKINFVIISDIDTTITLNPTDVLLIQVTVPDELMLKMTACNVSNSDTCIKYFTNMYDFFKVSILESLTFDRLAYKCKSINSVYSRCNDWNKTFTYLLFDTIAISTSNRPNFVKLAERVYVGDVISNLNSQQEVEALLFGVAGLLMSEDSNDEYTVNLKNIYRGIKLKYHLVEMDKFEWHFNYRGPNITLHIVIARLAALLYAKINFVSTIAADLNVKNIYKIMRCEVSPYWLRHTHFSINTAKLDSSQILSDEKIDIFIINAIVPLTYAIYYDQVDLIGEISSTLTDILIKIKGERNSIITKWEKYGSSFKSAFDTQAIIHLEKNYCKMNECGNCILFSRMAR